MMKNTYIHYEFWGNQTHSRHGILVEENQWKDLKLLQFRKKYKYNTSLRRLYRTDHKEKLWAVETPKIKSKTGKEESSPEEEKVIETNSEFQIQGSYQTKESKFTCTQCFKILSTDYSLRRHIRQMHENKGRFECTLCQRWVKHVVS